MDEGVGTDARDCSQPDLHSSRPGITGSENSCETGLIFKDEKAGVIHDNQVCFGMVRKMNFLG